MSNSQLICISEIASKIDRTKTLEEQLVQAFRLAMNHWLITEAGDQQRCAIIAVAKDASEADKERLQKEVAFFEKMNAASHYGLPVDLEQLVDEVGKTKFVGIGKLWEDAKR